MIPLIQNKESANLMIMVSEEVTSGILSGKSVRESFGELKMFYI